MGAAASCVRDRVRGRAANSEEPGCVEEEETSNQPERLPELHGRLELCDGLTSFPP
jgi:hypothetical protein